MDDKYLWLEEVDGVKARLFASEETEKTLKHFRNNPLFNQIKKELKIIQESQDRLPAVELRSEYLYNFWQDEGHVKGIWRRILLEEFQAKASKWEILLDLDKLSEEEEETWVWQGADFLKPCFEDCLLYLSRGGSDASVVREFNIKTKKFNLQGFNIPQAKTMVSWEDINTIFVGSDFGPGSLTKAGYARTIRVWKRGEPLSEAKTIFSGDFEDNVVYTFASEDNHQRRRFFTRAQSFYEGQTWELQTDGQLKRLDLPLDVQFYGCHSGDYILSLRSNWKKNETEFVAGSVLSLNESGQVSELFKPAKGQFQEISMTDISFGKKNIYLNLLDNIRGKIIAYHKISDGTWSSREVPCIGEGCVSIGASSPYSDSSIILCEDFLTPPSMLLVKESTLEKFQVLKETEPQFDSSELVFMQKHTISKDGTQVPYFLVHKKNLALNGNNPTYIYGYGGFEVSLTPKYLNEIGKAWVEKGGVYVLANLRGGGEFGPQWHQSVLREKRSKVYEDLIAIAENLISLKITTPAHLGISGRSNGGLLTGATFVMRPDLFNAVLIQVPLLDMLRYHKLLAGASWIAEYGNPDDELNPQLRETILAYSPFQNVKSSVKYPEVFIMTSTKDDRVHPGHARKMAAKMIDQGHRIFYYENQEGGHAGSAGIEQKTLWQALEFSYLCEKLGLRNEVGTRPGAFKGTSIVR